ncbi:MAG: ferrous iron transport protein A [Chthoniobacterales bacterium]|nr:ferrous iron transport protein A [Chthoniobacterales bacterium]
MPMPKARTLRLDHSPRRQCHRVVSVDDSSEWAAQLRRIGFHEGAEVEVLCGRDPVMVRCQNGQVAVRRCMLGCVEVCAMQEAQHHALKADR